MNHDTIILAKDFMLNLMLDFAGVLTLYLFYFVGFPRAQGNIIFWIGVFYFIILYFKSKLEHNELEIEHLDNLILTC